MEEDTIIQKDLFPINHELKRPKNSSQISEDLSTEELKKESHKRPRQRKISTNLINKFKNGRIATGSHRWFLCMSNASGKDNGR